MVGWRASCQIPILQSSRARIPLREITLLLACYQNSAFAHKPSCAMFFESFVCVHGVRKMVLRMAVTLIFFLCVEFSLERPSEAETLHVCACMWERVSWPQSVTGVVLSCHMMMISVSALQCSLQLHFCCLSFCPWKPATLSLISFCPTLCPFLLTASKSILDLSGPEGLWNKAIWPVSLQLYGLFLAESLGRQRPRDGLCSCFLLSRKPWPAASERWPLFMLSA